ncbi:hypothetical protein [Mobilicoccus massiliensis]|uniref:hypothetical protein n=1 Tax=Mobilicoccus massiliensis TaxID=1522310 RepID=UPI00069447B8|nr:hypothetical protein [Mobilicoccus massiliensis]
MRAHRRLLGAATAAAVLCGATVATAPQAEAASGGRSGLAAASVSGTAAAHYRVVRASDLRRRAATPARSVTLAAVTKAVRASEFTDGVPASAYTVRNLRTSGSWARVTLQPKKTAELDPATVLLQKSRAGWKVVDLGTAEVGCDVAPNSTLKALRLSCG